MTGFTGALLVVLTLQRSGSSILLHKAGKAYSTALAILLGELLKLTICTIVAMYQVYKDINVKLPMSSSSQASRSLPSTLDEARAIFREFLSKALSKEALKVFVPAALYVVQNNLYLYASGRLQPSTLQALWQVRLIPTAYLSQVILQTQLGIGRWLALCVILAGVIAIQQGQYDATASLIDTSVDKRAKILAIGALMVAAVFASLAGVLLEKVYQQKQTSLWIANVQLSTFSVAPAAFILLVECQQSDRGIFGPFQSFGLLFWPWVTVLIQGVAGVLVALTTQYAGCIAASLSGIAAIAATHLIELLRGRRSDSTGEVTFCLGFALLAIGVAFYTLLPTVKSVDMKEPDGEQGYRQVARDDDDSSNIEMSVKSMHEKPIAVYIDDTLGEFRDPAQSVRGLGIVLNSREAELKPLISTS